MRTISGDSVSGVRSRFGSGIGIGRYQLLPILLAGTLACNTDRQLAPISEHGPLSPRFASVTAPSEITIWHDGVSYTLTASTRELRSSDGRKVFLDDELTANVRTAFQSILEGDVLEAAIESAIGPGGSVEPEPYRTGERSPKEPSRGDVVFTSGRFSTGRPLTVRIITGRQGNARTADGDVSITSADMCGDIAGVLKNTATSFRVTRDGYGAKIREVLLDNAIGATITSTVSEALMSIGVDALHRRWSMGTMITMWNSYDCMNRTIYATGFVMTSLEPGPGGFADEDGITTLYCYWSTEWVEVAGQWKSVWLRVCSFKPQTQ